MSSQETPHRSASLRRIPSLDGLRAISIALVIGLHTIQRFSLTHPVPLAWYAVFNGGLGVYIFFVISGYLITRLLLHEQQSFGRISVSGFYLKRAFRILPPLWAYVGVVFLLHLAGRLSVPPGSFAHALLFVQNYSIHEGSWAFEHFWSLSVEEQFYLLWPPVLILSLRLGSSRGQRRAAWVCLGVIALSPAVRILSYRLHQPLIHNGAGFHMHADSLLFGCAAALLEGRRRFEQVYRALTRYAALPLLALVVDSFLEMRFQNYWDFPIGQTVAGILITVLLLWCVRNPAGRTGRLLNARWITHLGVISYSMYLWQTLFLHHGNVEVFRGATWLGMPPLSWIGILLAAELSHFLIERPSLHLRNRLFRRLELYRGARVRAAKAPEHLAPQPGAAAPEHQLSESGS